MNIKLAFLVSIFGLNLLIGACQPATEPVETPPFGTETTIPPAGTGTTVPPAGTGTTVPPTPR